MTTITATTTHATPTQGQLFESFTFSDGATIHVNGGLVCSQHGRYHCRHHKAAHRVIVALASSHEGGTATCKECGDALRSDTPGPYCEWCAPIQPALKTNAGVPLSDDLADTFNADYDAYLDSLPACHPLPEDFGLEAADEDEGDDPADACDLIDLPFFAHLAD